MDAPDDRDLKLQKAGSILFEDLQQSLPKFLYSTTSSGPQPRFLVRRSTTAELIKVLEPFQEWPQLLDPQLAGIVSPLTDAFLRSMSMDNKASDLGTAADLIFSLNCAICKILYTVCKIRGPKTITRFFQNEARYLEPMLDSLQAIERNAGQDNTKNLEVTWEEKYIHLLWLSHLLFTPFDLSTIGSSNAADTTEPVDLELPSDLPAIAKRLINEAVKHLQSPSKEREGAVKVLIRLSLRADMLKLGLHASLINWNLAELKKWTKVAHKASQYASIGHLSFLAGMTASSDARIIFPFLLPIFKSLNPINPDFFSAVGRKVVIKIYRSITLAALQLESLPGKDNPINVSEYVLEDVIDHLLNSMSDKDTPVRYAASKALSMITIKLGPELAAEISEAVTGTLGENVLWDDVRGVDMPAVFGPQVKQRTKARNLSAVNPLRWHGLTLALAQLLFQRSPPPSQLPPILNALIVTLNFEQRGSSGISVGANVRDAANFGVWSLARRYSTDELSAVEVSSIDYSSSLASRTIGPAPGTILQILAVELVQAACLDPSGNIRRGSSAALQELIGRHPDQIVHGIAVVQTVDYHAVALRQRAFESVAVSAAKLDTVYWDGLLEQLLGWRGICASDAPSRRYAARTIGLLAGLRGFSGWQIAASSVWAHLGRLGVQDIEKRHGLLLSLEAILQVYWDLALNEAESRQAKKVARQLLEYFGSKSPLKNRDLTMSTLRPELTAEAVPALISSLAETRRRGLIDEFSPVIKERCFKLVELCMGRQEDIVIAQVSKAAASMLSLIPQTEQSTLLDLWITKSGLQSTEVSMTTGGIAPEGFLSVIGAAYSTLVSHPSAPDAISGIEEHIWNTLLSGLDAKFSVKIEVRTTALKSIRTCTKHCRGLPQNILDGIETCLYDYTIDQRGDIGSLVRLGAIDVVQAALEANIITTQEAKLSLLKPIATLAGEKLDKVRLKAWTCLHTVCIADTNIFPHPEKLSSSFTDSTSISTPAYFTHLLDLTSSAPWLPEPILLGLLSSVGTGSSSVLRASRHALASHLTHLSTRPADLASFTTLLFSTIQSAFPSDRLCIPALQTLAFTLQLNILQACTGQDIPTGKEIPWRETFMAVQEAHRGSGVLGKVLAAVEVYFGMCSVPALRRVAGRKLVGLMGHRFPMVRNAAAEAVYVRFGAGDGDGDGGLEGMRSVDWAGSMKVLKGRVEEIRGVVERF